MRACKWEFGGQVGAVHIEQHQVKKIRAKARYWLPPRQRMDQVAPYNQPGSLPTAERLRGWFEARVAHRISPRPQTVLGTTLASRPHRPAICHHLLAPKRQQPQPAGAVLPPGLGCRGHTRREEARRRGTRDKAHTWHRSKSVRACHG